VPPARSRRMRSAGTAASLNLRAAAVCEGCARMMYAPSVLVSARVGGGAAELPRRGRKVGRTCAVVAGRACPAARGQSRRRGSSMTAGRRGRAAVLGRP
jgi:hypothetical protein